MSKSSFANYKYYFLVQFIGEHIKSCIDNALAVCCETCLLACRKLWNGISVQKCAFFCTCMIAFPSCIALLHRSLSTVFLFICLPFACLSLYLHLRCLERADVGLCVQKKKTLTMHIVKDALTRRRIG